MCAYIYGSGFEPFYAVLMRKKSIDSLKTKTRCIYTKYCNTV